MNYVLKTHGHLFFCLFLDWSVAVPYSVPATCQTDASDISVRMAECLEENWGQKFGKKKVLNILLCLPDGQMLKSWPRGGGTIGRPYIHSEMRPRDSNRELSRDGVYMPPHLLSCSGDEVVGFPLAFTLTVINCLTPSPKAMGPPDHKLNPLKPWIIINLFFVYIISSVCYRKLTDTLGRMLGDLLWSTLDLFFSWRLWGCPLGI